MSIAVKDLVIGSYYNWKDQPERLVYLGYNWSGNGYWHQFALVEKPGVVWCEVLDSDLKYFEKTEGTPENVSEVFVVEKQQEDFDLSAFYASLSSSFPVGKHKAQWKSEVRRSGRR